MQSRSRLVIAGTLVALAVAACGSSASGSVAPSSPAPADSSASPAASVTASPAASVTASPAASDAAASPAPAVSAAPAASPTPEEQALIDRLPKTIGGMTLTSSATTLQDSPGSSTSGKAFVDLAASLGVTPDKVLLVYMDAPASLSGNWSLGAFRFIGADPAKMKDAFVKTSVQQGYTVKEEQVGGRTVTGLSAPSTANRPPEYLVFSGDTVFFAGADGSALASQMVQALPQ